MYFDEKKNFFLEKRETIIELQYPIFFFNVNGN